MIAINPLDCPISRAEPEHQFIALSLILSNLPVQQRKQQIQRLLDAWAEESGFFDGLLVAIRDESVVGAIWVQFQAGSTASFSLPVITPEEHDETANRLVEHAVDLAESAEIVLAQVLLDAGADSQTARFEANGFKHLSDLLYLVSTTEAFPTSEPSGDLDYIPFDDRDEQRLARLIERTYQGSLDCPQVDGMRSTEDVLAGYRATGQFDPSRWLLVARDSEEIGCLLLAEHPEDSQWELVYLGVVPEARGAGVGLAITRYAQWLTRGAGYRRLVLAVDAENDPAIQAYAEAGFQGWDRRTVMVRDLD